MKIRHTVAYNKMKWYPSLRMWMGATGKWKGIILLWFLGYR